jgi:hypothetical protein
VGGPPVAVAVVAGHKGAITSCSHATPRQVLVIII